MVFTKEQKRQYAIKMAMLRKAKSKTVTGYGGYRSASVKGTGGYKPATTRARTVKVSGRGAYKESVGEALGGKIGKFLGGKAQELLTSLAGFGDYTVEENSIMKGGMSPPEIVNSFNNQSTIIRHREYLGDITSSQNFEIVKFPINPGQEGTFPWLSQIAKAFTEYRFRGLVFEFKSTSSDAVLSSATSSSLGAVIMATNYNAAAKDFEDKRSMENSMFASSSKPSQTFYHPIECKAQWTTGQGLLYVRTGAPSSLPEGTDIRWADTGNFYIATQGQQVDGGSLGELWCTFEIEFRKQVMNTGDMIEQDHWEIANPTNQYMLGSAISTPSNGSSLRPGSIVGTEIKTLTDGGDPSPALLFPTEVQSGIYKIDYSMVCSGAATGSTSITNPAFYNCEFVNEFKDQTLPAASTHNAPFSASYNQFVWNFFVKINLGGGNGDFPGYENRAVILFYDGMGFPQGGSTEADLFITKANTVVMEPDV